MTVNCVTLAATESEVYPEVISCLQLHGPGTQQGDFKIDFDSSPGSVHLYGIESPGLTSSLAIGSLIVEKLLGRGSAISSKL